MFFLDSTGKSLQLVLGGTITTTELTWVVAWADITSTTFIAGAAEGVTTGTTPVTAVPAPAAATQRQVKYVNVYNADTVVAVVTVDVNDGSGRPLVIVALAPGQSLVYDEHNGWQFFPLVTEASNIAYSPAAPSDWAGSPPATVAAGMDRLAAAVDGLVGPIP